MLRLRRNKVGIASRITRKYVTNRMNNGGWKNIIRKKTSRKNTYVPLERKSHDINFNSIYAHISKIDQKKDIINRLFSYYVNKYTSIENRPGSVNEIISYIQRSKDKEDERFIQFLLDEENFNLVPYENMDLLNMNPKKGRYPVKIRSLLGIGGQGCVLSGSILEKGCAIKINPKKHKEQQTTRHRSPIYKRQQNRIVSINVSDDENSVDMVRHMIADPKNEELYREALAMFTYASNPHTRIFPQPILYGIGGKLNDYEFLVTELAGATLQDFIRLKMDLKEFNKHINDLWVHIIRLVVHCAYCNLVHMDIKPDNICIGSDTGDKYIGLIDFGISKTIGHSYDQFISDPLHISVCPGTVTFMSPRTHAWCSVHWLDDLCSAFFTVLYFYSRLSIGITVDRSNPSSSLDNFCLLCWQKPSWDRLPYLVYDKDYKKRSSKNLYNQLIISACKCYSIFDVKNENDIYYVLTNADGYLDEHYPGSQDTVLQHMKSFCKAHGYSDIIRWWLSTAKNMNNLLSRIIEHSETTGPIHKIRDACGRHGHTPVLDTILNKVPSYKKMLAVGNLHMTLDTICLIVQ